MTANQKPTPNKPAEGWEGWDDYAPFYDWENAQTMGRRDVRFWQKLARKIGGRVLELGCGTGRISIPVARTGVPLVGVDRSALMLARARKRANRVRARLKACATSRRKTTPRSKTTSGLSFVRGDIRRLPFRADRPFDLVMAPYGILQSLLSDNDLKATLESVASVLAPGGTFGVDLVADLPAWKEYSQRMRLRGQRGSAGSHVTLLEAVRQDAAKGLTIFDQEFIEMRNGRRRRKRFSLAFRTVSVQGMRNRLQTAGFEVTAVLGDYHGAPWDERADVWLIIARKQP